MMMLTTALLFSWQLIRSMNVMNVNNLPMNEIIAKNNNMDYPLTPPQDMSLIAAFPRENQRNIAASSTNETKRQNDRPKLQQQQHSDEPADIIINNHNANDTISIIDTGRLPAVLHFPSYLDGGMELQLEVDGLNNSQALQWIHDASTSMLYPNVSWMGSPRPNRPCNDLWLEQALDFYQRHLPLQQQLSPRRRQRGNNPHDPPTTNKMIKPDWTIHLSDWYDVPTKLLRCVRLEKKIGSDKFRYWKRSIVQGRQWNNVTQSMELGRVVYNISGAKVHFLAYPVRSDMVQTIENYYVVNMMMPQQHQQDKMMNTSTATKRTTMVVNASAVTDYLVTKDRPGDVAHYWPATGGKVDRGSKFGSNSELRTKTSETLLSMMLPPYHLTDVYCNVQGSVGNKGRKTVSEFYVESMLHYKIIVVAQRDNWEGHWRMFEAMVSGAMVIHDRMLAVPLGLEENVNIVLFDNMEDLKRKVMYYLTHEDERLGIARRGRQVAMCSHRSWHRIEQIVLGRPMTPCYE